MISKSLVSVILPIYNKQEFLARCVDSLIQQSYNSLEIILVDDGSTDNSWLICQDYVKKDNRIVAYQKANGGLSDARNYGLSKATGEWVSFVDPDDWVESDYIKGLLSDSSFDLSICSSFFVNDNRRRAVCHVFGNNAFSDTESIYSLILKPLITLEENRMTLLPCVWNKLYRKSVIDSHNLKFDIIPLVEDYLFNIRYLRICTSVRFIDLKLYNYDCSQPQSLSKNKNYLERIQASEYAHQVVKSLFPGIGEEVYPSVMLYNIKNCIISYARNIGFVGFRSFCDDLFEMDSLKNISSEGTIHSGATLLRRKNLHLLFVLWAFLFASKGFLKHYILMMIGH